MMMLHILGDVIRAYAGSARTHVVLLGLLALGSCAHPRPRPPLSGDVAVGRYVDPSRHFTYRLPGYAMKDGVLDRIQGSEGGLALRGFFGNFRCLAWSHQGGHGPVLRAETIHVWSQTLGAVVEGYGVERSRVSSGLLPSETGEFWHEIWEVRYENRFASNKVLCGFALCASSTTVVWLDHSTVLWNSNWLNEERHANDEDLDKERAALTGLIERVSFDDPLLLEFGGRHGPAPAPPEKQP